MTRPTSRGRVACLLGPEKIELREVDLPVPAAGELLVTIDQATTCGTDLKVFLLGGHPRMLAAPTPFGHEWTGVVRSVGPGVASFAAGDAVLGANSASCGTCAFCVAGRENLCPAIRYLNGAFADFLLVPDPFVRRSLHLRPARLPVAVAALAEPLACVEHAIERLRFAGPCEVLVLGGGALGQLLAAALTDGGHAVALADPHAARRSLARELGAAEVLPVERRSRRVPPFERRFEVAIDATGRPPAGNRRWQRSDRAARPCSSAGVPPGGRAAGRSDHYDELALLGCYHYTPRAFRRAIERLASNPERYTRLVTARRPLQMSSRAPCVRCNAVRRSRSRSCPDPRRARSRPPCDSAPEESRQRRRLEAGALPPDRRRGAEIDGVEQVAARDRPLASRSRHASGSRSEGGARWSSRSRRRCRSPSRRPPAPWSRADLVEMTEDRVVPVAGAATPPSGL
ncbi:MAG: alcohol dehydrogenase catalytic domain-containing protein [Thermoanaerobaculia bacterium]